MKQEGNGLTHQSITINPTINITLPPDKVIIELDELNELREHARPLTWKTKDVINQLGSVGKSRFTRVIKKHETELLEIGAIWQLSRGSRATKSRVSVMAPWLDKHLGEFGTDADNDS